MKLTHHTTGSIDVARIEGRVDASGASEVEAGLMGLVRQGNGPLVIDFAAVDYVSSAGLRVLLIVLKALAADGRRLLLAALNADVKDVISLTGFDKLIDCHENLDDAITAAGS